MRYFIMYTIDSNEDLTFSVNFFWNKYSKCQYTPLKKIFNTMLNYLQEKVSQ